MGDFSLAVCPRPPAKHSMVAMTWVQIPVLAVQLGFLVFGAVGGGTQPDSSFRSTRDINRQNPRIWSLLYPPGALWPWFGRTATCGPARDSDACGDSRCSSSSHARTRAAASYFERAPPEVSSNVTGVSAHNAKQRQFCDYARRFWILATTGQNRLILVINSSTPPSTKRPKVQCSSIPDFGLWLSQTEPRQLAGRCLRC